MSGSISGREVSSSSGGIAARDGSSSPRRDGSSSDAASADASASASGARSEAWAEAVPLTVDAMPLHAASRGRRAHAE